MDRIEKQWDEFAEKDPYFAVASFDRFYTENLDEDNLLEFFQSGEEYTDRIWRLIETHLKPDFHPKRSLDFGCGVGRLAMPIAKRSKMTVGVDLSQGMLDAARNNAEKFGIKNLEFVKGDDELSRITGKFDFVNSFIVIQHINPKIGEGLFEKLIDLIDEGGIGALHVTYRQPGRTASILRYKLYRRFPFVHRLRNIVLKKKKEPLIPVYAYDLNRIFEILQRNDCHQCLVRFSDHGHLGVHILFQKMANIVF